MKNALLILGGLIILAGFGQVFGGGIFSGAVLILLGLLLLPAISNKLENNFKFWQNKGDKACIYGALMILAFSTKPESIEKKDPVVKNRINDRQTSTRYPSSEFTCNYGSEEYPIIPGLTAADVYINFENRGFSVDKQIKHDHTSIICELNQSETNYKVAIDGCTPEELVEITALAIDYSGNNQQEIMDFFGFTATLQYKGAEPENAKKWVIENFNRNGSHTTISGVTFKINFKNTKSRVLTLSTRR